jgi:drug/metabolite transporter (DMT)-like permease
VKLLNNSSPERKKGIAFAMTDVLAMTGVYIFSKIFLTDLPFPVFGIYWFSAGLFWNIILSLFVKGTFEQVTFKRNYLVFLALIGIIDMTATLIWFKAVDETANPSLVSFMTNISPMYALLLGFFFLKERMSISEIVGIFITLAGAVLIGYNPDFQLKNFLFTGAGLILISSFISQAGKALLKTRIKNYHAIVLSINRIVFLLAFSILFVIIEDYSIDIGLENILLIALGAMLGPLLSAYAGFNALARLKVATYSILSTSRSFFVMIASFLVLNNLPDQVQIVGGLLTVAGVILISVAKVK